MKVIKLTNKYPIPVELLSILSIKLQNTYYQKQQVLVEEYVLTDITGNWNSLIGTTRNLKHRLYWYIYGTINLQRYDPIGKRDYKELFKYLKIIREEL